MKFKLLTLNAHSVRGEDADRSISELCEFFLSERPDVVALQEADQTRSAETVDLCKLGDCYKEVVCPAPVPLKNDNFALLLSWELARRGQSYYFCWLPVKLGYGRLDEGLAFLSKRPMESVFGYYISKRRDYCDWKTRMALIMRLKGSDITFCNLHTSRYDDPDEPFADQWERLCGCIPNRERAVIMGDLNCPAEKRGEGYDAVCKSGYIDVYRLADLREGESATVSGDIDGWRDGELSGGGRIDYILTGFYPKAEKICYRRVFDGERGAVVSDHFGVSVIFEGSELDF